MKKSYFLFLLGISFLFSACESFTGEIRTIEKPEFEIALPDWLEETTDLAPHALYQFKSRYRNTYGIVVKQEKGEKSFAKFQQEAVGVLRNFEEMSNLMLTDSTFENNTYHLQFMGDLDSEKVFYWHNTYESADSYYELVLWTRSYDRKQKYTPIIEDIIKSFQIKD